MLFLFNASSHQIQDELNNLKIIDGTGGIKVTQRKNSTGFPGNAHQYFIYFSGEKIMQNVENIIVNACSTNNLNIPPYNFVRTIVNGGKVEHQRVSLSADSLSVGSIPAFSLMLTFNNIQTVETQCIGWGTPTLNLNQALSRDFKEMIFKLDSSGITEIGQNKFKIHADRYIEGVIMPGEKIQIGQSCICYVATLGLDGKSTIVTSEEECKGKPNDSVFLLVDGRVIEHFSERITPRSAVTELILTSDKLLNDFGGIFKMEITFKGESHTSKCLPYNVSASNIQSFLQEVISEFNSDRVMNNIIKNHVLVSEKNEPQYSQKYRKFILEIRGEFSDVHSVVLGTESPRIKILGIGSHVGCNDVGGDEVLITVSASVTNSSMKLENINATNHFLHAGSRLKIQGSTNAGKIYTVNSINPESSSAFLTEAYIGASGYGNISVYEIVGPIPQILTKEVVYGSNEYEYDLYFMGKYWHDVPLLTVNQFGDSQCQQRNHSHALSWMNRNIHVSEIQKGGVATNKIFFGLDKSVRISGENEIFSKAPVFSVRKESFKIINVVVEITNMTAFSIAARQPLFKIINKSGQRTECIAADTTEDALETAMNVFCPRDKNPSCVTVIKSMQHTTRKTINYSLYFEQQSLQGSIFSIANESSSECLPSVFNNTGIILYLEYLDEISSSVISNGGIVHLGVENNPDVEARWIGNSVESLSVFTLTGHQWILKFDNYLGDVPSLIVHSENLPQGSRVKIIDNLVIGSNPSSALIPNLSTGISHFARVYALNSIGRSEPSNVVHVIPHSVPPQIEGLEANHAVYANEVQSITVTAAHISEIQMIATKTLPISEIQELTVGSSSVEESPPRNGSFALRFAQTQVIKISSSSPITSGSFYLELEYIDLEMSILQGDGHFRKRTMKTPCIPFGAPPDLLKKFIEDEALINPLGKDSVEVSRSGDGTADSSFGYEYTIKFIGGKYRGHMQQFKVIYHVSGLDTSTGKSTCIEFDSSSKHVTIDISTSNDGKALGTDTPYVKIAINTEDTIYSGYFALIIHHLGKAFETPCLPWNSDAGFVKEELESLPNVDSVRVFRRGNGLLSDDHFAIKDKIQNIQFMIGESPNKIKLATRRSSSLTIKEMLKPGCHLQFLGQLDNKQFYKVLDVDESEAVLNSDIAIDLETFQATIHFNYEFFIFFDGQGMHPTETGIPSFFPSSSFSVSANNCSSFLTLKKNISTRSYDVIKSSDAIDIITTLYDGGSSIPVHSGLNSMRVSSFLMPIISPSFNKPLFVMERPGSIAGSTIYTINFGENFGNMDELLCNPNREMVLSSIQCTVNTIVDGNMISGYFYVGSSMLLSYNATAKQMEEAINSIAGIKDAQVSKMNIDDLGSCQWMITFHGNLGDVEDIAITEFLLGKNSTISVTEIRKGNQLDGTFQLLYKEKLSNHIPYNVSATTLKSAIEGIGFFNTIYVSEIDYYPESGKTYLVTFMDYNLGDIELLTPLYGSLRGIGATVSVREIIKGSDTSANKLHISFLLPKGCSESQVSAGGCGSPITNMRVEIAGSKDFPMADLIAKQIQPDYTTQVVRIVSQSFVRKQFQEVPISGSFQLKYDGHSTAHLPFNCGEIELRVALEELPGVTTVTIHRTYSTLQLGNAYVDLMVGSSIVRCSPSCSCNFLSSGLRGNDVVKIRDQWFRVLSSCQVTENDFQLGHISNSLIVEQYEAEDDTKQIPLQVWAGGYEWIITFNEWEGELQMLSSPQHDLYPLDSSLDINLLDCNKCLTVNNLHVWSDYFVRVNAKNKLGWGTYSEVVHVITKSIPSVPSNLRVDALSGSCIEVSMFLNKYEETSTIIIEWDTL
jgi:hypothetical protein